MTPLRTWALCAALSLTACSEQSNTAAGGQTQRAAPAVAVETAAVTTRPLTRELVAVGSLRSDESVTLSSEIAGRIAEIGFTEGKAVKAGQLLFALDSSVHRAELDQARANHTLAKRNFDRARELFDRKLVSQADRDQAAANLDVAAAALALAQALHDKTRITAPFAGVAGLRMVSPGDYVNAGQSLVNVEAMDKVKVDFRVDESALSQLRVGQTLDIELDAYPGEHFSGEVYAIDPRVAEATRSVGLRARLPNPDGRLRPGQFARVRLAVEHKADAIVIPERAIFPRGDRQFVYVVANGKAELREVGVGQRVPGSAEIVRGLNAGETLVVSGLQRLSDGIPVRTDTAAQTDTPAGS